MAKQHQFTDRWVRQMYDVDLFFLFLFRSSRKNACPHNHKGKFKDAASVAFDCHVCQSRGEQNIQSFPSFFRKEALAEEDTLTRRGKKVPEEEASKKASL